MKPISEVETVKQQLDKKLYEHFGFDGVDGSYFYVLTRSKEAFNVGTMTFDDFEEFDEEILAGIVQVVQPLINQAITQTEQRVRDEMTGEVAFWKQRIKELEGEANLYYAWCPMCSDALERTNDEYKCFGCNIVFTLSPKTEEVQGE